MNLQEYLGKQELVQNTTKTGANSKSRSIQLANEEWKFDGVGDDELDACFYYEFARSSKLIRDGIKEWRASVQKQTSSLDRIKLAWKNAPTSSWNRYKGFCEDEREFAAYGAAWLNNADADKLKPASLCSVDTGLLDFVASFPEFPKVPWQRLRARDKKASFSKDWKLPDTADMEQNPEQAISDSTQLLEECDKHDLSAWKMIKRTIQHPSNAPNKPGLYLFSISWNYRNDEIARAFETWCQKNRPPEYPEPKEQKKKLGGGWQALPFGKRAGLDYLGVYRRRDACGWRGADAGWKKFMENWPPEAHKTRLKQFQGERAKLKLKADLEAWEHDRFKEAENDIREFKAQCSKVKDFLAQIEGGAR